MDYEQRAMEIRELRKLLLDVQFAARRQVGELEQLKRLLAKLREFSKQLQPVEFGGESLASGGQSDGEETRGDADCLGGGAG